jgi:penicillin G amidase
MASNDESTRPRGFWRRRWRTILLIALVTLLAMPLLALVWLRRSLPRVDGTLQVAGVTQPVEIVRDANAIPHILAQTEPDAYFGLGYAHAQDRLWQLEFNRRLGSGRLAEVLGEPALRRDRMFRTLGLRHVAEQNIERLDARARAALSGYVAGVNAFLASDPPLSPEFALLGIEPEPWSAVDSLIWLKVMAWTLSNNMDGELSRLSLSRKLSPEQLAEFVAPYPGDPSLVLRLPGVYEAAGPVTGSNLFSEPRPVGLGSNNWAVDGRHSESGKPLLANDPHLALTAPGLWYLAHLQAPGFSVIGATLPSLPGVILGRTEAAAWAFTNTGSDVQDLYLERVIDGQPDRYAVPGGSEAFALRNETIAIRGGGEQVLEVRSTRHGPVISDVHAFSASSTPPGHVIALRWTALEPDDHSFEFVTEVAHAETGADVLAAARRFQSPTQNIVYADTAGQIGFIAAGRVPVRSADSELKGLAPALGWEARYDWQGYLPFDQLPQSQSPATGRIVTANQKIVPEGYEHWLGAEWVAPARAQRIEALLDEVGRHSVASFARIQSDVHDGTARQLLPGLLSALDAAPADRGAAGECSADASSLQAAIESLRKWDEQTRVEQPEPLLFAAWVRELASAVYADELGAVFDDYWSERPVFMANVLADRDGQGRWCDDVKTAERESCPSQVRRALCRGLSFVEQHYGKDPASWHWGEAHVARARHMPLTTIPVLRSWFDVVAPSPGGSHTVNAGAFSIDAAEEDLFVNRHAASLRAIYDLGEVERSTFILRTGQSGHFLSSHYRDWVEPWSRAEAVPMTTQRRVFERDAMGTLRLTP